MPDEATIEEEATQLTRSERLAEVAVLLEAGSSKAIEALAAEARHARDEYAFRLARGLMKFNSPVDQREIDYKRGFWQGALWASEILPGQAQKALSEQRAADEETKEATA